MAEERSTEERYRSATSEATAGTKEEPRKSPQTILVEEIVQGMAEYQRPTLGLMLSGLAAGLEIGFSVLLMAVTLTLVAGQLSHSVTELLMANMYAIGFILVIIGRSELFTEHTTLAVLPVLARQFSILALGRVWAIIFIGNLLGCLIFTTLLVWIAPAREIVAISAFERIAEGMTRSPWWVTLLSAILAGWLMGDMAWIVAASRDTIAQIFCVWLIAAAIGFAKLHHCIVGSIEVLAGVFTNASITFGDYWRFLMWATLGNTIGGVVFVALIKFGHASRDAPS